MARTVRRSAVRRVPLSEIKDDLSRDWFAYRLERDPRFLRRIEQARKSLGAGRGVSLEELGIEP